MQQRLRPVLPAARRRVEVVVLPVVLEATCPGSDGRHRRRLVAATVFVVLVLGRG